MKVNRFTLASLGFISLTLFSGFILLSSVVLADDFAVDNVNITVPAACTLSGTGNASHNATINSGTYATDIGTTTLKASCNDTGGFAIYAAGYTGDEVGGTNSTKLVGANNIGNISTGTGTSGNSQWAMKLATDSNATYPITIESDTNGSFASYHIVPEEFVKVATRNSSTDVGTTAIGSVLTTTYQVYISTTQAAGAYSGAVIYTLVHPSYANSKGCNPDATTINNTLCMQDFITVTSANKTAIINSMVEGTQYTLKDSRDGKTYTVAKLADGNVWMTQNLDLDLDSSVSYTNLDTDLGWNGTSYSTAAWSPSRSTYATATNNIHEWCQGGTWNTQYSYCELNNTPESYDPGNLYWNSTESHHYIDWYAYYNSCDFSTSTPACNESLNPLSTYTSSTGTVQYHLGNYYNWPAAIASNDASIYGTYNETTHEYENLETNQSICPAGWTLPYTTYNSNTDQDEGDFADLWTAYGWSFSDISTLWSAPLYSAPTGWFYGGLGYVGYRGDFWSSVAEDDVGAMSADLNVDGRAIPAYGNSRDYGLSVRCLLR